ncbi:MAG: hypothetical protein M5U26_14535 [Planctomycetota bacterium]|nr:hypothetical protein [Planctomycetota bacterium]
MSMRAELAVLALAAGWAAAAWTAEGQSEVAPLVERVRPLAEDPLKEAPGVFFYEDLETIQKLGESFQDVGGNDGRFRISDTDAFSGKRGIQQEYLPGKELKDDPGNAGWCWRFFGDNPKSNMTRGGTLVTTAVARWYHKFEAGFEPRDVAHWVPKFGRMRCFTDGEWHGAYSVLYWIAGQDGHLSIERHTKAPGVHREWLPNHATRFEFARPENVGRWIHFELRVALGEGPRADRIQAWADGLLICDVEGDDLAGGYRKFGLNGMSWDCYWNGGSPKRQSRYFDDLMLGTQPIGPARTPLNPEIVLASATGKVELEVAEGMQETLETETTNDGLVTRHKPLAVKYATVWRGQAAAERVTVNGENGAFVGPRAGKEALAANTLHFVRARRKGAGDAWGPWSAWHAGFATEWPEGTQPAARTPPEGYLAGADQK